ncbi:MAG: RNA-binding transcriptional accessory protein, partial [Clostridia bacterium]|nr:RNA-binding transcriptional accessory protein [Clostridia bacterium]
MNIIEQLAKELACKEEHVEKAVEMLDEGNTVPFIARYRKEVTGSMEDETLRKLEDRLKYLRHLEERRAEITASIEAQEKMTPELQAAIDRATALVELEDLYLPYRPKRKTRASVARDRGLEPLATLIASEPDALDAPLEQLAEAYVDEEKGLPDVASVLQGASDIIAEDISNTADYRKLLRTHLSHDGAITAKAAKEEDSVYADYYEYSEPITKMRPHRILALNRGEKEGFLKVDLCADEAVAVGKLMSACTKKDGSATSEFMKAAATDSYGRLIFPALEREIRGELFDEAAEGALKVFSENLKNLLLIAPVKGKTVLGFDPGYAHGCKLAVVDKTGKYLTSTVIYPTKPREDTARATQTLLKLIKTYKVDIIAIGNGTASRESER